MTGTCMTGGGDGGAGDGSGSDANACWHGVSPSNFAPCDAFPPAIASFPFINGEVLDADHGVLFSTNAPAPGERYTFNGHDVWLINFTSWAMPAGRTFNVSGSTPLLVVADGDISIDGTVNMLASSTRTADCGAIDGGTSAVSGAGGGGGGHGATGGPGGTNGDGDTPGPTGGLAQGDTMLVPLTTGCSGGAGGPGGASNHGGRVGLGGGGVELASQTKIAITGRVLAAGGGGGGGGASAMGAAGCMDNAACAGGGGGGGAGGGILLEALEVDEAVAGSICAGGGGGGEGGDATTTGTAQPGSDGGCIGGAAGVSPSNGGDGGAGSLAGDAAPGLAGVESTGIVSGGGGGGGAPGRIRVHAMTKALDGAVLPAATP